MYRKLKTALGNLSLQKKLLLSFGTIAIIPMLILGIISSIVSYKNQEFTQNSNLEDRKNQYLSVINSQLKTVNTTLDYISYNNAIQNIFNTDYSNVNYAEYYKMIVNNIDPVMYSVLNLFPYINGLTIYKYGESPPSRDPFIISNDTVKNKSWYQEALKLQLNVTDIFYDGSRMIFARRYVSNSYSDNLDIIALAVDPAQFFSSISTETDGLIFQIKYKDSILVENGSVGKEAIKTYRTDYSDLNLYINEKSYLKKETSGFLSIMDLTAIAIMICFLLVIFVSFFLSSSITRRLNAIMSDINKVSAGDMDITPQSDLRYNDEIGVISKMFFRMVERLNFYINKELKHEIEMKNMELTLLQEQINPHMLYNSFSMIHWQAIDCGSYEIKEIVTLLSDFYRTSLSSGKSLIPISDEIINVKSFLNLQQKMHKNKFLVFYSLDEELFDYIIPKMTLQPIVENAIEHGILQDRSKMGVVKISAEKKGDEIIFIVADNGIGINTDKITEIFSSESKHFGIKNVDKRIKLLFGNDYGLNIESIPNEYTKLIINIPIQSGE